MSRRRKRKNPSNPKPSSKYIELPPGYKKDGRIDLRQLPYINERPLLRHGAEGLAWQVLHSDASGDADPGIPIPTIEIDPRYTGRKRLECIIHEAMHLACPYMPESTVLQASRYIAMVVWYMKYREDEKEKNKNG